MVLSLFTAVTVLQIIPILARAKIILAFKLWDNTQEVVSMLCFLAFPLKWHKKQEKLIVVCLL